MFILSLDCVVRLNGAVFAVDVRLCKLFHIYYACPFCKYLELKREMHRISLYTQTSRRYSIYLPFFLMIACRAIFFFEICSRFTCEQFYAQFCVAVLQRLIDGYFIVIYARRAQRLQFAIDARCANYLLCS